ncbi:MAG: hypothetical protein SAJ37_10705 [Oscillatoria sp. PMC 1068.18]|nr:hypothetical protein [Oscillatoria sp. PMC 1076.18]MEC4989209.1 hypothetical protein [Oscillatoria sp. PMC 1068.18]
MFTIELKNFTLDNIAHRQQILTKVKLKKLDWLKIPIELSQPIAKKID